jgi:hypothetical protein
MMHLAPRPSLQRLVTHLLHPAAQLHNHSTSCGCSTHDFAETRQPAGRLLGHEIESNCALPSAAPPSSAESSRKIECTQTQHCNTKPSLHVDNVSKLSKPGPASTILFSRDTSAVASAAQGVLTESGLSGRLPIHLRTFSSEAAAKYVVGNGDMTMRGVVLPNPNERMYVESFQIPKPKIGEVLIKTKGEPAPEPVVVAAVTQKH